MSDKIFLCAISNITSGSCKEDCSFCTQSSKYKANIERFKNKPIKEVIQEAIKAKSVGAIGFCLVSSGRGLDDKRLEFVCKVAYEVNKEVSGLSLIACNGVASVEHLRELKKNGIKNYNHNLETSKEYYPNICTTHSWEERFQTCLNVKEAGLELCSGGIFGLGESQLDRVSLINSLKKLSPKSIPINFFHPNKALPIKESHIKEDEALSIISQVREAFSDSMIMVAGGREFTFKTKMREIFKYGANSIVIGDYLTTAGAKPNSDLEMLKELNLKIADSC